MIHSEKYQSGLKLLEKLHGGHAGAAIVDEMSDICPDYAAIHFISINCISS